ncbi:hypothetical protein [Rubritalea tangerina]|uniref:hypothetical protein n=1 Tax=Rubritalea tangerina TaxID=430798 RepID=UPI00361A756F
MVTHARSTKGLSSSILFEASQSLLMGLFCGHKKNAFGEESVLEKKMVLEGGISSLCSGHAVSSNAPPHC